MRKLILRRLSSLPNTLGSFCYAIVEGDFTGISGVYDTPNGKCMYSPVRLGAHNTNVSVQAQERKVGERTFLNLTDPDAEKAGALGSKVTLANRAGFGAPAQQIAAELLFGTKLVQSVQANQAVQAEQPAASAPAAPTANVTEEEHTEAPAGGEGQS